MKQNKRRLFPIVDREKQYTFLAIVIIYIMIIVGALAISLFLPDVIQLADESLTPELRGAAAEKMLILHSRVWPGIFAIIVIIGIHWFHVFHRIVGPLYRFKQAFEQIGNGDLNLKIQLRERDYLHQEKDELNRMIQRLDKKMKWIQQSGMDIAASMEKLNDMIQDGILNKDMEMVFRNHQRHCDDLLKAIGQFRL